MKDKSYSLDHVTRAGSYFYKNGSALYMPNVIQSLLSSQGDKQLQHVSIGGILLQTIDQLFDYLKSKGGKLVIHCDHGDHTFIWADSYLDLHHDKKANTITIVGYVLDPELMKMAEDIEKDYVSIVKKKLVFTIVKNGDSLAIHNMGDGSSPLIASNYLPQVLEDVDFVIKAFSKSPPIGRICILNGEPGSGKTHLIRSILMHLDCIFLIVPSNMVESLDKPELVPLLLSIKSDYDKPIILIIEDGDACLVPRKSDNISTIASLLNLSDGIMGSIIDIKMIISTNADIREMDQAIMRPGRLCRNIHVGPLPYEQSNQVYQRLMQNETALLTERRHYTLAEIYDKFNNIDMVPTISDNTRSQRVIGFGAPQTNSQRTMNSSKIGFGDR